MAEQKLCTSRGARKRAKGHGFDTFPCGMIAEPGVEHCTVHLTDAEKRFLHDRRRRQRAEEPHAFVAAPADPNLCGWCGFSHSYHKDATFGG